jgi:hypothetical protein
MNQEFDKEAALTEIIRLKHRVKQWQDTSYILACVVGALGGAIVLILIL